MIAKDNNGVEMIFRTQQNGSMVIRDSVWKSRSEITSTQCPVDTGLVDKRSVFSLGSSISRTYLSLLEPDSAYCKMRLMKYMMANFPLNQ